MKGVLCLINWDGVSEDSEIVATLWAFIRITIDWCWHKIFTISSLLSPCSMQFAAGVFRASLQVCHIVENNRNSFVKKLITVPFVL